MDVDFIGAGSRLQKVADLARHASRAGFSGVVLAEGGAHGLPVGGRRRPGRRRLGPQHRHRGDLPPQPDGTAEVAWELADASDGRFTLGLGTQVKAHVERRYGAAFDPPGPRLREYVQAVRAIFRAFQGTEKLNFEGRFYRHSRLPAQWSPGPIAHPDIPIYVSAVGPWMLRKAGEVADGVHVHPFHSRVYLDEMVRSKVAEGAAPPAATRWRWSSPCRCSRSWATPSRNAVPGGTRPAPRSRSTAPRGTMASSSTSWVTRERPPGSTRS